MQGFGDEPLLRRPRGAAPRWRPLVLSPVLPVLPASPGASVTDTPARVALTPRAGWSADASTTPRAPTVSAACPSSRTARGRGAQRRPPTSVCVSVRGPGGPGVQAGNKLPGTWLWGLLLGGPWQLGLSPPRRRRGEEAPKGGRRWAWHRQCFPHSSPPGPRPPQWRCLLWERWEGPLTCSFVSTAATAAANESQATRSQGCWAAHPACPTAPGRPAMLLPL